ncbi:hypothetical protein, partial [Mesorhizobium sp. BR1-1-14]|uniref:hypothetical protein n=1 Tax=Mesorhizobium sp. BR1-1-14 TaxID=2876655 RepID=UPI001CD0CE83
MSDISNIASVGPSRSGIAPAADRWDLLLAIPPGQLALKPAEMESCRLNPFCIFVAGLGSGKPNFPPRELRARLGPEAWNDRGLALNALAWLGLAWLGLAWLGLACMVLAGGLCLVLRALFLTLGVGFGCLLGCDEGSNQPGTISRIQEQPGVSRAVLIWLRGQDLNL